MQICVLQLLWEIWHSNFCLPGWFYFIFPQSSSTIQGHSHDQQNRFTCDLPCFLYYKASLDICKVHLKSARKEHQKSTHKAPPTINYKQLQQHISWRVKHDGHMHPTQMKVSSCCNAWKWTHLVASVNCRLRKVWTNWNSVCSIISFFEDQQHTGWQLDNSILGHGTW